MKNKKNSGIIVNNGKLIAENIVIGKGGNIETSKMSIPTAQEEKIKAKNHAVQLIGKGQMHKAITFLSNFFEMKNDIELKKMIVLLSSRNNQLNDQLDRNIISQEQFKIERTKIEYALLNLIEPKL